MTSISSLSMAQVKKLFGAVPSLHGRAIRKPEFKAEELDTSTSRLLGKVRQVTDDALYAMRTLNIVQKEASSPQPVSPAASYANFLKSLEDDGDDDGHVDIAQITTFEGSLAGSSYSLSVSVNQEMDAQTGAAISTSYSFNLSVNDHFVMSGWVNGGRDPSTDPVQINLGFSYDERAVVTSQQGDTLVQEGAFRAISGQLTIDAGSLNSRWQGLQDVPSVQISTSITAAAGSYASTSPWVPTGYSRATELTTSLQASLQVKWGA